MNDKRVGVTVYVRIGPELNADEYALLESCPMRASEPSRSKSKRVKGWIVREMRQKVIYKMNNICKLAFIFQMPGSKEWNWSKKEHTHTHAENEDNDEDENEDNDERTTVTQKTCSPEQQMWQSMRRMYTHLHAYWLLAAPRNKTTHKSISWYYKWH